MQRIVSTLLIALGTLLALSQADGLPSAAAAPQEDGQTRPNVVWIIVEDMSANFSCYGEETIRTPHVDHLAAEGVRFTNAVVTGPVCSACRSALVTGMYQTSIGAHHHRSGRGRLKISLPGPVTPVPKLMQQAGYLSLNVRFEDFLRGDDAVRDDPQVRTAKTDYNFEWDAAMYDGRHWRAREKGQPFFCQIQLHGGKYRGHGDGERWPRRVVERFGARTKPDDVTLPPYLPRHPVLLEDWAQYLDTVRYTDWEVGQIVERLREAGELDRTYLFFITDHGISHVRNKQFCYDGGIHVPLIVRGPSLPAGEVRRDPVEHIDLAATTLALAGADVPAWMQARDILADDFIPRRVTVSARDRCDETVDRIRALRSRRWKYIRNFHPQRPYLQPNRYKDDKPIVQTMRRLAAAGQLNEAQAKIMADHRPPEELYDLKDDPFELHNLADDPEHRRRLRAMRRELQNWIKWSGDRGQQPEPEAMYDSDMAEYRNKQRKNPRQLETLKKNIALMKRWAAEGK